MITSARRWHPAVVAALAAVATVAVYRWLPASMTVHWDLRGHATGWLPRPVGAALLPALIVVLWAVLRAARVQAPPGDRAMAMHDRILGGVLWLLLATHLAVLAVNLGVPVPMARAPLLVIGALFIVIGRAMPLAPTSSALGVRTPWTLSSERVWQRTHLLAGQLFAVCGALMIVAAALLPVDLAMPVLVAAIVAAVVAPAAYSWLTWTRESRR